MWLRILNGEIILPVGPKCNHDDFRTGRQEGQWKRKQSADKSSDWSDMAKSQERQQSLEGARDGKPPEGISLPTSWV